MVEYLDWDSNFFNLKIGKIENYNELKTNINIIDIESYDLIYFFNHSKSRNNIVNGCVNVDIKITYSLPIKNFIPVTQQKNKIETKQNFTEKEKSDLIKRTVESGIYSRFFIDKNFPNESFERLYEFWLISSLDSVNKKIFFSKSKEEIIGILILNTSKVENVIEILSVSETFRGQGIARDLIIEAYSYSCQNNKKELKVATQFNNFTACKFYENFGFKKINEIEIYHLWKK